MGFRGGAGALRRRITLQRLTPGAADSFNARAEEYVDDPDFVDLPSTYEVVGGSEFPAYQKRHSETKARHRIRYRQDLDLRKLQQTHRVKRIHNRNADPQVVSFSNITTAYDVDERHVEIVIEVSEVL